MKLKGILKFYCLYMICSKSGCCCHIMATIWMLDEYSRKNLVQAPSSKSKTSRPQAWGIPNQKRKITHEPVMETKVVRPKHISNAVPNKQQGLTSTLFDPRPVGKQGLDINGLNEMSEKLKKSGLNIPYARMVPSIENFKVTTTVVGVVAQGSLLDVQLKNARLQSSVSANEVSNTTFPDLPLKSFKSKQANYSIGFQLPNSVLLSLSESHELFRKTLGQSSNETWKRKRTLRLTASNFGKILNRKHDYSDSFIQAICHPLDISNNPWVKYGNENEGKVADLYKESMHSEGKQVELHNVGLCVNPTLPHLGTSLDRGVFDPSSDDVYGGLEVKTCPKAGNLGLNVAEAVDHQEFKNTFFLQKQGNGMVGLKRSHNYYYQIQGQLALTTLPWVDFVGYSGIGDVHKERIYYDEDLWESIMLPKLNDFYALVLLQEYN